MHDYAGVLRGLYSHSPSGNIPVWMLPDRWPLNACTISLANSRKYKIEWRTRKLAYLTGSLSLVQRLRGLCCMALGPPTIWARPLARANGRAYVTGSLSLVQRLRGLCCERLQYDAALGPCNGTRGLSLVQRPRGI